MIAQLLTAHPVTGAIRALTPGLLREALLLPRPCPFELLPALAAQTDAPWPRALRWLRPRRRPTYVPN